MNFAEFVLGLVRVIWAQPAGPVGRGSGLTDKPTRIRSGPFGWQWVQEGCFLLTMFSGCLSVVFVAVLVVVLIWILGNLG